MKIVYSLFFLMILSLHVNGQIEVSAPYNDLLFEADSVKHTLEYSAGAGHFVKPVILQGSGNELVFLLDTFAQGLDLGGLKLRGNFTAEYCGLNGLVLPAKASSVVINGSIIRTDIVGGHSFAIDLNSDSNSVTSIRSKDHVYVDSIDRLQISITDEIGFGIAENVISGDIILSNVFVADAILIEGTMDGNLDLSYLKLGKDAEVDLSNLRSTNKKKILLNLHKVAIEKLRLRWGYFKLDWCFDSSYEAKCSIYEALLANFRQHGQQESLVAIDREYQSLRKAHVSRFWDKLNWLWWDYGYAPSRPILWTLVLLFLWTLVNLKTYSRMQNEVYSIGGLKHVIPSANDPEQMNRNRNNRNLYTCFIYTAIVFFAISLKLDTLRYDNRSLFLKFLGIYLTGIFCLFFIAHYLLKG